MEILFMFKYTVQFLKPTGMESKGKSHEASRNTWDITSLNPISRGEHVEIGVCGPEWSDPGNMFVTSCSSWRVIDVSHRPGPGPTWAGAKTTLFVTPTPNLIYHSEY
jgi:hypothetical protein